MSHVLLAGKTDIKAEAVHSLGFDIGHDLARAGMQFGLIDLNAAEAEQAAGVSIGLVDSGT